MPRQLRSTSTNGSQTRRVTKIRDLIPAGALDKIDAPRSWRTRFISKPRGRSAFSENDNAAGTVSRSRRNARSMFRRCERRTAISVTRKREGSTAVSLPYVGNDLQFVVLLPDEINGLHALESKLTGDMLG